MSTVQTTLYAILFYYLCLHSIYFTLILIGATQLRRYHRGINFGDFRRIAESPLTLPFTVVIPAYNEEKIILGTVVAALRLRYPLHEVIVVNDGSRDDTLRLLIDHFNLRLINKVGARRLKTRPVRGVYESFDHPNLIVVDKENGQRADAINAAVNLSRYPLLCIMDADCVFEEDALLRAVRPFLRDTRIIAASGIVRPANGLKLRDGRIESFGLPERWVPLFQAVEYLRSFQWARLGLARLNSMLSISGAFMVVRKDVFVGMGGVDATAITDDIEFTVRLYKYVYEHKRSGNPRIGFIPDPVCHTEVPETLRIFAAQRNRWQRGTLQALLRQWRMTFNPRYGMAGMFGVPFFLVFEASSAVVEVAGYLLTPIAYFLGLVTIEVVVLFFILAVVLGTYLSIAAILLQERTRLRVGGARELRRMMAAAFLENLGFHQMHLAVRFVGTFEYLVRRRKDLGSMERHGGYQQRPALPTKSGGSNQTQAR